MFAFRTHRKLTEICKESGRYYLISGKFTPIENEKLIRQINQLDVVQDGLNKPNRNGTATQKQKCQSIDWHFCWNAVVAGAGFDHYLIKHIRIPNLR